MRHSQSRPGRRRPWILNRDKAYSDASSERAAEINGGAAQRPGDGVFDGQRRGTETETNPQLSGLDEIGNPGIPGGLRRSGVDGQRRARRERLRRPQSATRLSCLVAPSKITQNVPLASSVSTRRAAPPKLARHGFAWKGKQESENLPGQKETFIGSNYCATSMLSVS
jgi:hypothetical protein